jgi:hypothetical protein
MKWLVDIFAIIGVVSSVLSTYVAYLTYENSSSNVNEKGIRGIKASIAEVIAPSGYSLTPSKLQVIRENTNFTVAIGDSALLTESKKYPLAITKDSNDDGVFLMLDGSSVFMKKGSKENVHNTNCYIWLYQIQKPNYTLQLRCGNENA